MSEGPKFYYATTYVLMLGIVIKVPASEVEIIDGSIYYGPLGVAKKGDWFDNEAEMLECVKEMRTKRIASLQRQLTDSGHGEIEVINPYASRAFDDHIEVDALSETARGSGGFGSTGR